AAGPRAGKEEHIGEALLIAGCVITEHEHWPMGAVAKDANSRPNVDRPGNPVSPFRNKDYALRVCVFLSIDCVLDRSAVVTLAICVDRELARPQVTAFWA